MYECDSTCASATNAMQQNGSLRLVIVRMQIL